MLARRRRKVGVTSMSWQMQSDKPVYSCTIYLSIQILIFIHRMPDGCGCWRSNPFVGAFILQCDKTSKACNILHEGTRRARVECRIRMGAYKRFVMQECVSLMMHEVMMLTAKVLALVAAATIETCLTMSVRQHSNASRMVSLAYI